MTSVLNVQVVKTWKSEYQFPHELYFVFILDNFQFKKKRLDEIKDGQNEQDKIIDINIRQKK